MTNGIEIVPPLPDTKINQRPSTGSSTSTLKKANPGNLPMAASGISNSWRTGSSNVGGRNSSAHPSVRIIRVGFCHQHKHEARQPLRPDRVPGQHATRHVELVVHRRSRFGQKGPRNRHSADTFNCPAWVWPHGQPLWGSTHWTSGRPRQCSPRLCAPPCAARYGHGRHARRRPGGQPRIIGNAWRRRFAPRSAGRSRRRAPGSRA